MTDTYEKAERVVHGRRVLVQWCYDTSSGAPWAECDGHGPVRESRSRHKDWAGKQPGERPLHSAGRNERQWFYDWQEAMKIAKKDSWYSGCVDTFMHLTAKHGRVPTKGMVAAHAVERDFDFLSGWCNNEWHWCGIVVTDRETGIDRSLWGIESTDEHGYHEEVISDLAEEMWEEVCQALLNGEHADEEDAA